MDNYITRETVLTDLRFYSSRSLIVVLLFIDSSSVRVSVNHS